MSRDALVVGINAYQYLPSLQAPAQDAEAIAHQLQTYGDFRVSRLPEVLQANQPKVGVKTPVTLRELEAALVRLFKPKGANVPQTALFYFSGHGLQKDAGIQEGYLAVSDSQPDVGFYGLSLFWLRRLLQESPVRQRIVLLDCCNSGEFMNFLEADPGAHSGTDRLFMAASREYESAYESLESSYSVFTQALLAGLDPRRIENGIVTNYSLTDWVSNALKGEIQQPLFENSGSEIVLTRCTGLSTITTTASPQDICPYRGLEYFDEVHAEYFFGREDFTDQLLEKLRAGRFVAIVGASGSGKSSLVRAGLIHELRQGRKFSGSDRWQIKLLTPAEHPLTSLAAAFIDPKATGLERAEQLRRAEVFLKDGGSGLAQLARASISKKERGAGSRFVLVIDQFEEVFTLCQGPQAEQERHRFFNCLVGALQEAGAYLSIVIVLRADFFSKCSLYNNLAQQIEQNLVTVTPLTYEQIKASIVKPAQKVDLICEPNLVYTILLDIVGAPGELPLLQYTLLELWQRRQADPKGGPPRLTLDAYTELGGVRGTLQKQATEIFYSLTPEEQLVAQRIFLSLTQLGEGTEDTRRRVLKSELVSSRFSMELVERVLEKLVAAKLIVTNQVSSAGCYQEQVDQGFANVSTALRLIQLTQGKAPRLDSLNNLAASQSSLPNGVKPKHTTVSDLTKLAVGRLSQLQPTPAASSIPLSQETVDVAHEALIRNWPLLRTWLDNNREMLRRQRQIEQATREWDSAGQPSDVEYLLRGSRLIEAEDYLKSYPNEISVLAQRYVAISQEESHRAHKESRVLQVAVPCALLAALAVTFNQYHTAVRSQAEKDYQIQMATSRQWAAIAQKILQEPDSDPTTALLISRLAVEKGERTYEAQASLRTALQKLRLQAELQGHQGAIHQVVFSPDHAWMATGGANGTIRLWSLDKQSTEPTPRVLQTLHWAAQDTAQNPAGVGTNPKSQMASDILSLAFSPDGSQLAATAKGSQQVQVWSVKSGTLQLQLAGFKSNVTQVAFSPAGQWIAAASADNTTKIWRTDTGKLQAQLSHPGPINSIQFSPDGQLLLTAGADGTAQLWQTTTGKSKAALRHDAAVNNATFSPSGQLIATACDDGKAQLWTVSTGKLRQTFSQNDGQPTQRRSYSPIQINSSFSKESLSDRNPTFQPVLQVLFSPDEQFLATADLHNQVKLWNIRSGQLWAELGKDNEFQQGIQYAGPEPLAFSPDSQLLVTASRNQVGNDGAAYTAQLWETRTGRAVGILFRHLGPVEAAQFSPDGAYIATASTDGAVRLWANDAGELPSLKTEGETTQWVAFLPPTSADLPISRRSDEAKIGAINSTAEFSSPELFSQIKANGKATEAKCKGFCLWQWISAGIRWNPMAKKIQALSGTASGPSKLPQLVTVAVDGTFRRWDSPTESSTTGITGSSQVISLFKTVLARPSLALEKPKNAKAPLQIVPSNAPELSLAGVAFSADQQLMATANVSGVVEIWQVRSGQPMQLLRRLQTSRDQAQKSRNNKLSPDPEAESNQLPVLIRQLAFSSDGQRLLGIGEDLVVHLWNVESGQQLQALKGHQATVSEARFSADRQRVITASWDRTARIWDAASGKTIKILQHQDVVSSAYFSPDGQQVITGSWDGTARVLDAATGTLRVLLAGHRGPVLDAEFSPDGRSLVTASADGTARLWDAQTGTEQAQLRPNSMGSNSEPLQRAFFSPDGQYVATLSENGQVRLWAATWEALLKVARDRSLRQLTPDECIRYLRLAPNACPALQLNPSAPATSQRLANQ